jgi:ubiquinone/menaquinone biosynthesis C-methylase UbiE
LKTEWDYTTLADAYLKRPDYSQAAIDSLLSIAGVGKGDNVCDVGAGVAHLTLMLAKKELVTIAVEPNDAMRENGKKRTSALSNVTWIEGTGESTTLPSDNFSLVTFGSSFNVCSRLEALSEARRILKHRGWFACMWNHRDLSDPIQSQIERIIQSHIPTYGYGTRREDQSSIIDKSGLFKAVIHLDSRVIHRQSVVECVEAWKSHATLERQADSKFGSIVDEIESYLVGLKLNQVIIPYVTNIWMAQAI